MKRNPSRLAAPVLSLSLSLFAFACSDAEPERTPPPPAVLSPELPEGATSLTPAEGEITPGGIVRDPSARPVRPGMEGLLVSEVDGVVLETVPTAVLADVRAQLLAAGATEQLALVDRRYDLTTGQAKVTR